ncbi:protein of unknown function DUF547 [Desulfovibrio sp. X2]|uniref:DUF547 domain-containing protein n=1 Tax=Desulfovibrio sp. X2 TaxID=941449 RepID=UPI000358CBBB|nr:DUF547 domain-containing protein [Desulfovibrio sp. X2]EPR44092.1 protein of unknown function DUF547 [Desulfovibrio sp. X2]
MNEHAPEASAATGKEAVQPAPRIDDTLYAGLLARNVSHGLVDYPGLLREEKTLDTYLDALARVNPEALDRAGQMAYWINAYNAWTLKLVLDHYPVSSIKKIGPFWSTPWKIEFVRIRGNGGKERTVALDYIEHSILRPRFKDPRVHFAVNCASRSCPPLRAEPYEPDRLDEQLDDQASRFLNSPDGARLVDDELYVSKIFDWFGGDFGGEEGVLGFVRRYAQGDFRTRLIALGEKVRLRYMDYDWSLNSK